MVVTLAISIGDTVIAVINSFFGDEARKETVEHGIRCFQARKVGNIPTWISIHRNQTIAVVQPILFVANKGFNLVGPNSTLFSMIIRNHVALLPFSGPSAPWVSRVSWQSSSTEIRASDRLKLAILLRDSTARSLYPRAMRFLGDS